MLWKQGYGIAPDNPGSVLVWLAVSGLLSVDDLALYESAIVRRLSGAVACLRLSGAPHLSAGLDDLERFGTGGAVRLAAEGLWPVLRPVVRKER